MKSTLFIPRVIRFRDAPHYLGMDRGRFNAEVRPLVPEFRIGCHGIGFDRLDLDAWLDDYKSRNERPTSKVKGDKLWDVNELRGSGFATESGSNAAVWLKILLMRLLFVPLTGTADQLHFFTPYVSRTIQLNN